MNAVWVISTNTLRQTVRERLFHNLGVFGIGMLLLAMLVGQITFGFPDRVVRSIGLSGVAIALDLMALLLGVALIHQEIDRKTLFVVLTRPVRRWQYVFGRFLGLLMTLILATAGLGLIYALTLAAVRGTVTSADLWAILLTVPEAAVLGGVGVLLSSFTTPTLGAGIGAGIWIAGSTTDDLVRLATPAGPGAVWAGKLVSYVLPSLSRFNFRETVVYQSPIDGLDLAGAFAYGVAYTMFLVIVASMVLSRREML